MAAPLSRRAVMAGALALAAPVRMARAQDRPHTLLFGGDVAHGEMFANRATARMGYDEPFAGLRPLLDRADWTVVNLETPLTARRDSPFSGRKQFIHYSDPERAPAAFAALGIDAVSLANNHMLDQGAAGLADTIAALERHGIAWGGAGPDAEAAAAPLIRRFEGRDGTAREVAVFASFQEGAWYEAAGFYAGAATPGTARLDVGDFARRCAALKAARPGIIVIAFPHWGANYAWASALQKRLGRGLVEAGADLVIGHGAHHLQEVERWQGRWIFYGIGNFMFASGGRFAQFPGVFPVSLALELVLPTGGFAAGEVRAWPLQSDNLATGFRTRLATSAEAGRALVRMTGSESLAADGITPHMQDRAAPFLSFALG